VASAQEEKLARLALDRGLITVEQLSKARVKQRALKEKEGVEESLARVLLSAGFISDDDIRKIILAVAEPEEERSEGGGRTAETTQPAAFDAGGAADEPASQGRIATMALPVQQPQDGQPGDPPRVIGGYEIIGQVGSGAVGNVFKARKAGSERLFAVKVLSSASASADFIARFKREIEAACRLSHPNVVSCVEFGYDPARASYFCVMDFADGENLKARVERAGPLSEHEALVIVRQVGMALRHAYENGLVHRDVRPDNIVLASSGQAKLLGLGLAQPPTSGAYGLKAAGSSVGSPSYSSPEQARGESTVDIRTDIYSLGATMYFAVTGRQPFAGARVADILAGHTSGHLPWLAEANPELSQGLCLIVAKAMAKDPAERYLTPVEFTLDLDIMLQGMEPVIAKKAPSDSTVAPPSATRPRPKNGVPQAHRGRPRSGTRMAEQHGAQRARPVSRHGRPRSRPALPTRSQVRSQEDALLEEEARKKSPIAYLLVPLLLGGLAAVVALSVMSNPEDAGDGLKLPPPEAVVPAVDEGDEPAEVQAAVEAPVPAEVRTEAEAPVPAEVRTEADAPVPSELPGRRPVFAGHAYMLFRLPLSWQDAKTFCEERGGYLVTIGSQEEQDFVVSLVSDVPRVWIGLADAREEGVFEWVTGEPVDYTAWLPGEPNDAGDGEDLGEMRATGGWNDFGGKSIPAFICEWDQVEAASRLGGLSGEYFADLELKQSVLKRVDVIVDCMWDSGSPAPDVVPVDKFAVRWRGFVLPPASGDYVFITVSDDNARLWIDGKLVIDDWPEPHGAREVRAEPIRLEAGKPCPIRLEFREFGGIATIRLLWEGPGIGRQVVPPENLRPAGDGEAGGPF
jgi:serine/threonine protein kinase